MVHDANMRNFRDTYVVKRALVTCITLTKVMFS